MVQDCRMAASKPKRDAGSRTMLDILLHRKRSPHCDDEDLAAGHIRIVTCHLRSTIPGMPDRFRYGELQLSQTGGITWKPWMRSRGELTPIPTGVTVHRVRPVGGQGEWNIKKGLFEVIEAANWDGKVELAVPTNSVRLVVKRLTATSD
jgi:hypothetical protein